MTTKENQLKDSIWDKCYQETSTLRECYRKAMSEYAKEQRLICAQEYGERGHSYDSRNDMLIKNSPEPFV